jgi:hypothetical protein
MGEVVRVRVVAISTIGVRRERREKDGEISPGVQSEGKTLQPQG